MKLETFFEKFDQFADAPNAVGKMRELVLELALRGKLVPQNIADEPASELVKRIHAEKVRRKVRVELADEEPAAITRDEDFEIPPNWEWVGATMPSVMVSDQGKKIQTKDILEAGKYPVVDQGKVFIRGYCNDSDRVIKITEPLVLFGDHTRETKLIDFDFVVGADGVKLLQPVCIEPRFYFLALRWLPLESRGYARHFKLLKAAIVPIPPLAEQKRIVAKVDELMALCDRLEAQQQERDTRHAALSRASLSRFAEAPTPTDLDLLFHPSYTIPPADLRKSILTLAVQGKLVPQDPNDEAVELPNATHLSKSPSSKSGKDAPFEIPFGWRWIQLGQLSELINGDRSKNYPNKAEYVHEGVPWINTGHIEPDGTLSIDSMHYITRKKFDSLRSGKIRPGDLVYCLRGATLGKTAIITQFEEGAVASSLVIIRLSSTVDPRFAYRVLTSPLGREQIFHFDNGSAQPNLSANNVKKYWIPVPPLAEQRRIVAKVDQLMSLVDQLETQLATSRASAANLMEALVAELTANS